jgi:hypothetical protein
MCLLSRTQSMNIWFLSDTVPQRSSSNLIYQLYAMTGDYRQNVITNLRCCFKFYGPRHFTLNLIFCCFIFCDKPNFLSLVRILQWQTTFCDKLNFVTNWLLWQTEFCDKMYFVTNWILWQTEFSVVSRLRRMVTNIRTLSRIPSYPFLSQTLSTAVTDLK